MMNMAEDNIQGLFRQAGAVVIRFKRIAAAAVQAAAAISARSMMTSVVRRVMVNVVRHMMVTGMMGGVVCRVMMGRRRSRRGEQ
jgi:hypothetical protein